MKVFISPFNNPFVNLALEDYFLRSKQLLPVAFFYVNRPCVVLGRFQNPWLECHLPYLVQNDIWLVRRQSGGGCVFQDLGNLNFSFITEDPQINRQKYALVIQAAFLKAGIELQVSPRNDLWLKDRNQEWKKISGSAYKQTKDASFHHGTFLISSDLEQLKESLMHTILPKSTKSISSVRSSVIKLQMMYPEIDIQDVIELIAFELKAVPSILEGTLLSLSEVQESFQKLKSWDWMWGETPYFELDVQGESFGIRKGKIEGCSEEAFTREAMMQKMNQEQLDKLFPDFSEQHRSSNLIF